LMDVELAFDVPGATPASRGGGVIPTPAARIRMQYRPAHQRADLEAERPASGLSTSLQPRRVLRGRLHGGTTATIDELAHQRCRCRRQRLDRFVTVGKLEELEGQRVRSSSCWTM
jgi:hypothetical protein